MKDLLQGLIALQNVELEIFKAEEGLKELPKEIDEIESIIRARKGSLDAVDEEIALLEEKKGPWRRNSRRTRRSSMLRMRGSSGSRRTRNISRFSVRSTLPKTQERH